MRRALPLAWHAEFNDPRLARVYDVECPWGPDDDYFLAAVAESENEASAVDGLPGACVLDLGCGTGRLTLAISAAGHRVAGVDPARASLDLARTKPGAERVRWIEGASVLLPSCCFDVAVLTSHVAQCLVNDEEWAAVLGDLRRALVPGGRLVFDSRDPAARCWERWNPRDSRRRLALSDGGVVTTWTAVDDVRDGTVTFTRHFRFADETTGETTDEASDEGAGDSAGETLRSVSTLRFRTEEELRESLRLAGFSVARIDGGWGGEPLGGGDGEFLVHARR
ncbi:class I SAM-dependent methyltransferase [Micromonospora echinofusca]|uniref:Methyltransferase domain-containing protein n=1 Tax=Micromonospora echinofusca TaxID=47858 RepID=A0ABS3VJG3_MICEH|nr:class I SAM-dependent methyltransferase [Micromonospora echinofusca]MBO4204660.1 methyltransferase domain-containing protein [Micromonospora echinofusca]